MQRYFRNVFSQNQGACHFLSTCEANLRVSLPAFERIAPSGPPSCFRRTVELMLRNVLLGLWLLLVSQAAWAQAPMALIGGGRVDFMPHSWSEDTCRWIVKQAGAGRILILTTVSLNEELPRYFIQMGADSAALLEIPARYRADAPEVYEAIQAADGLVISDGQLWKMISTWSGTRTESAIRDHVRAGKVLAGFGTGAMLMGSIIPDRRQGTLFATEALRLSTSPMLGFTEDFLQLLPGVMIESSFLRDGRLPPLLLEMATWQAEHLIGQLLGMGIDERTALLIDASGTATVLGEGAVSILIPNASSVIRLDPRTPPIFTNLELEMFTEGFVFDLPRRELIAAPPTAVPAFPDFPAAPFGWRTIDGSSEDAAGLGHTWVNQETHEHLALQLGLLHEMAGSAEIPGTAIMPLAFERSELWENRVGAVFWALARRPGLVGLILDRGGKAELDPTGVVTPLPMTGQPSMIVVDSSRAITRDFSHWKSWPDSVGPRPSVGIIGLRLHLLASRWGVRLSTGDIVTAP